MIGRRSCLLGAAMAWPLAARAQDYPARPVSLLVGFAPGGGTDIIARFLAPSLSEALGQPIAVENRPGASGTLAAAAGVRARPDGYTLYMTTVSASAVVPPMMRPPPFDILRDQTPIVLTGTVPLVAVVPASSPAHDLAGLVAHARAHPGEVSYGSSGIGTQQHLAAELLSVTAGIRMTHVPYRGTGQAINDLIGARIDLNIDTLPSNLPHIRGGALRALAVTTPERAEWLPEVPTVAESGFPGFDANVWYMLMGPAGLPPAISERWVAAVNGVLAQPELRRRIRDAGFLPGGGSAAAAAALLRRDAEKYAAVIRRADIRFE